MASRKISRTTFQRPTGTRDFYPLELLKRRYITETWRAVSIRHGFEEIDGPTFEHADLYTVKSGEGILSELFSFKRERGDKLYALRPEFTPTLARMYADKAASLPKPCRWFSIPSFFRAERPQRGRLREFMQWNCDVMGEGRETEMLLDPELSAPTNPLVAQDIGLASADTDVIEVLLSSLDSMGLAPGIVQCRLGDRRVFDTALRLGGHEQFVGDARMFDLVDKSSKLSSDKLVEASTAIGVSWNQLNTAMRQVEQELDAIVQSGGVVTDGLPLLVARKGLRELTEEEWRALGVDELFRLLPEATARGLGRWLRGDLSIVRGLAYYTGTVFEVLAEGERAIAGGGRYDNLIELFGGPPTPACGFGMGDVVLGNLLADHGLMPGASGDTSELMDAVHNITTGALGSVSLRPDVFVVSADEKADGDVIPLVAQLRRGVESDVWRERNGKPWDADRYVIPPMHARPTDKSTRKEDKLWKDAQRMRAKVFATVSEGGSVQLKNIDTREDVAPPSGGEWSANPTEENFVGQLFGCHGHLG